MHGSQEGKVGAHCLFRPRLHNRRDEIPLYGLVKVTQGCLSSRGPCLRKAGDRKRLEGAGFAKTSTTRLSCSQYFSSFPIPISILASINVAILEEKNLKAIASVMNQSLPYVWGRKARNGRNWLHSSNSCRHLCNCGSAAAVFPCR